MPNSQNYDFGTALYALRQGERVRRDGWYERGTFLFFLKDMQTRVMHTSLRAVRVGRWDDMDSLSAATESYRVDPFIAMKTLCGKVSAWAPSQADLLAEDWVVLPQ